jgi:histidyl-tRNA synthetase
LQVLQQLRAQGIAAELYPDAAKMKKQFSYADKKGIPFLLMIGPEEVAEGKYQLKDMEKGEQIALPLVEIMARLQAN